MELRLAPRAGAGPSVFALDTAGNRASELPFSYDPATGVLRFAVSTRAPDGTGRLYYEIVLRRKRYDMSSPNHIAKLHPQMLL